MQITRGKLKKIIQEELSRMVETQDETPGSEMAENIIKEFKDLSSASKHVFLKKFLTFLNEDNNG